MIPEPLGLDLADPYGDLRPRLRDGDLLMASGSSTFSRIIQRATRSPWSHVGVVWRIPGMDRVLVLESVESVGVRAVPLSQYLTYPGVVLIARHPAVGQREGWRERMGVYSIDHLGRPYDREQILSLSLRLVSGCGPTHAPDDPDAAYICSEYAEGIYQADEIEIPHSMGTAVALPRDFAEVATAVGVLRAG